MRKHSIRFFFAALLAVVVSVGAIAPHVIRAQSNAVSFDFGVEMGANHYMRAWGTLNRTNGAVSYRQRVLTRTWFGGYKGCTQLYFLDADDTIIGYTDPIRTGVDGRAVPWGAPSDRTLYLTYQIPGDVAQQTVAVEVAHWHCPNSFPQSIAQLLTYIEDAVDGVEALSDAFEDARIRVYTSF